MTFLSDANPYSNDDTIGEGTQISLSRSLARSSPSDRSFLRVQFMFDTRSILDHDCYVSVGSLFFRERGFIYLRGKSLIRQVDLTQ